MLSADYKTDARKKVQQTARSLLPNETEAPMVFTGNVRALRHIVEMRADEHAESEIRALALRLFACLAAADPILFGDYRVTRATGRHPQGLPHRKAARRTASAPSFCTGLEETCGAARRARRGASGCVR